MPPGETSVFTPAWQPEGMVAGRVGAGQGITVAGRARWGFCESQIAAQRQRLVYGDALKLAAGEHRAVFEDGFEGARCT